MAIVASQFESVRIGSSTRGSWQNQLRTAVRDGAELCRLLQLPEGYETAATRVSREFPVFAPLSYVARMRPGDPHDPLLRQVLPLNDEIDDGGSRDPVADAQSTVVPGMLQKYAGRVLLITTGACAIHCRYCFRRHFPYTEAPRSLAQWLPALRELQTRPDIEEVILSGGDPLTLVDTLITELIAQIEQIPHIRRLRVHTRLPVVIPDRVTSAFIDCLRATRLTPWVVIHANHPAELDDEVAAAITRLIDNGIPVLNQTVLLRGVNDHEDRLVELCRRLVDLRVAPYYLHQLDRVRGALHFEVPLEEGRRLVRGLRERLPGYAVPRYVWEEPGATSKVAIGE